METISSLPLIDSNPQNLQTFDPQTVSHTGKHIKLKLNPIFRYNYFLMCYNTSFNKINGITLKRLPRNKIYYYLYPILGIKYFLLQFALALTPYINLIWSIFLIFMWAIYERAHLVYSSNAKLLKNPLKKMIYDPELCSKYKCMNKFLEIPAEFIGIRNTRAGGNQRIKIMIYNNNFKKMYSQFPNYRYLHIFHILFCIFIIILSYIWIYDALGINSFAIHKF